MQQLFEHGGNIYQENPAQTPWLDFSANINPLGLSPNVRKAIQMHIDDVMHYPDPQGTMLKQALQAQYHIPYESIILGNGAAELFYVYMPFAPNGSCCPCLRLVNMKRQPSLVMPMFRISCCRRQMALL